MARWLGDTTAADMGRITLNPLKHIDVLTTLLLPLVMILFGLPPILAAKPVPFDPAKVRFGEYGAALVGLAGPLANFGLAVIGAILVHLFMGASVQVLDFWVIFIELNVALMIFNLIPFPPLDGSRVLYAFAPEFLQEILGRLESMGFFPLLMFIFILFQFIAPIIGHIDAAIFNFLISL